MTKVKINHELVVSYDYEEPEILPEDLEYVVIAEMTHNGYISGKVLVLYDEHTGISFTIDKELTEEVGELPWE